jgi:HTH-type transcriptional regulator/antitoxin HipB
VRYFSRTGKAKGADVDHKDEPRGTQAVGGQESILVHDPKTVGRAIRERRKKSGVTLTQAAGLAGVGVRFLHELEHGKPTASIGKALQVLERMGLEVWIVPRGTPLRRDRA